MKLKVRKNASKNLIFLVAAGLTLMLVFAVALFSVLQNRNAERVESEEAFKVSQVIDGDTIRLEDGSSVRYIGIDAPETHHPGQAKQCFGDEATKFNKGLVAGRAVRLEKDISDEDKYGRKLRFVFLEDGRMVNFEMIRRGFAKTMNIPPNTSKADVFKKAEKQARQEKLGLWPACAS